MSKSRPRIQKDVEALAHELCVLLAVDRPALLRRILVLVGLAQEMIVGQEHEEEHLAERGRILEGGTPEAFALQNCTTLHKLGNGRSILGSRRRDDHVVREIGGTEVVEIDRVRDVADEAEHLPRAKVGVVCTDRADRLDDAVDEGKLPHVEEVLDVLLVVVERIVDGKILERLPLRRVARILCANELLADRDDEKKVVDKGVSLAKVVLLIRANGNDGRRRSHVHRAIHHRDARGHGKLAALHKASNCRDSMRAVDDEDVAGIADTHSGHRMLGGEAVLLHTAHEELNHVGIDATSVGELGHAKRVDHQRRGRDRGGGGAARARRGVTSRRGRGSSVG